MAPLFLVNALADTLIDWFDRNARDLPWRRADAGPWGVLVSEIMLQQTPVARVEPVWHAWLSRWPTPAALAADPPAEAIRMWGRLGYPRRARTARPAGPRRTPAPTVRYAASCSPSCGRPPARYRRTGWTWSGPRPYSGSAPCPACSPTGWWSSCPARTRSPTTAWLAKCRS